MSNLPMDDSPHDVCPTCGRSLMADAAQLSALQASEQAANAKVKELQAIVMQILAAYAATLQVAVEADDEGAVRLLTGDGVLPTIIREAAAAAKEKP